MYVYLITVGTKTHEINRLQLKTDDIKVEFKNFFVKTLL